VLKVRGSRRAGVQEKKKKKCARSLDKMEEKKSEKWRREKNGRSRRESGKRQRAKPFN